MLKDLLLANAWGEISAEAAPDEGPGAGGGDRVLSALALLGRAESDPPPGVERILALALGATGAERIFFFEASSVTAGEPPTLGQCLASLNIDREPVLEPASKVPAAVLKEVLGSGKALFVADVETDPRWQGDPVAREIRSRSLGAIPLLSRGVPIVVLYFDHRFRPIELDRAAARELFALCQTLAALRHCERILSENRSLWQDIVRLKESVRED